jgi:hypothetical protein
VWFLPSDVSALSKARVQEYARARCSGARSIKPLEGSRPRLRRTRALCKFNCGKVRFGAQLGRDCGERAQQPAQREKRVTEVQNSREETARESGKTRLEERPGTERLSVPTHAKVSRCKESFHAAAVTRPGGERSWISTAVSLSMTCIGPPHFGHSQRSLESLPPDRSCSVCGADPSR